MLLVDLNQVIISNLMQQLNSSQKKLLDEDLIRHMVLNSLRSYLKQFKSRYGPMVICCDSRKYWRKDIFPFYKSNRKKDREKTDINWTLIFETINKIRDELKENFTHKIVEVEGAEADDIIGTLVHRYSSTEEILILSSDKDFVQLQKYSNVKQYSPILKKFVSTDDPRLYVKEHIMRGDRGDGIPNFLSADNVFALGERQKVLNNKKFTEWLNKEPEEFCDERMLRGYRRNQRLVDLDFIPEELKIKINETFDSTETGNKQKMMNYFIEKRLRNMIEVLDEF